MSSHINHLVGRRVVASIGEPWDFVSAAGENRLEGEIEAVAFFEDGQPVLLCSVSPFLHLGKEIRQVIVVNRNKRFKNVIEALHESQGAISDFVYLVSGRLLSAKEVVATIENPNHSDKRFLIGSVRLAQINGVGLD